MAKPTQRQRRFVNARTNTKKKLSLMIFGAASAACLGMSAEAAPRIDHISGSDLLCLALNVYHEARNQSWEGQMAVAHVTLNRLDMKRFPTVCDVVFRDGYFSWTKDQQKVNKWPTDKAAWETAQRAARTALVDPAADPVKGSTYFHAASMTPDWAPGMVRVAQIGDHVFYRIRAQ